MPKHKNIGKAWEVEIESDEDGFTLLIATDQGTFQTNIHGVAEELLKRAEQTIGEWLTEGASVRRIFECGAEEIDESAGAYELSDPKHPRYHSVHVDHYDNRDKLALAKEIGEGWGRVLGGNR